MKLIKIFLIILITNISNSFSNNIDEFNQWKLNFKKVAMAKNISESTSEIFESARWQKLYQWAIGVIQRSQWNEQSCRPAMLQARLLQTEFELLNKTRYFIPDAEPVGFGAEAMTFYFAKLKIEKAQSNVLADLKEENAKEKVDRDNDLIQMLDERSQYYKLSITNHEQTIQRLGNAYKEMTGEVWTAPRLKEKVQMKRPVYGSVRNYKNVALA